MPYSSYITDLHLNLHPNQLDELEAWYEHCRRVSDFFTLAYYPYEMVAISRGFAAEREIDPALMRAQWDRILRFLAEREERDGFPCLPGFEWQGRGLDGDHNVYFKDGGPIELPPRYRDLATIYRGMDAIAIPHHLAYALGNRGKRWETHDEAFSPVAEVFSHHGSSERDATALSMDCHVHMGPRVDDTSLVAGLRAGHHVGIICSGDNHEVPAMVDNGRAGVWAREYTKDALWEALLERRTFGFTGSRIDLWCEAEGHPQGSVFITDSSVVKLAVRARGNSRIERVELYRDGEIDEVHLVRPACLPLDRRGSVRLKFAIELGWGPDVNFFPDLATRIWEGSLAATGEILSVEPVFSSFDNEWSLEDDRTVCFRARSGKAGGTRWMRDGALRTEGFIFEVETPLDGSVTLDVDGHRFQWDIERILAGSFLEVFEEEAKTLVRRASGLDEFYRNDAWYHNAYKVKVHQGFTSDLYEMDDVFHVRPTERETGWFVKVVQADGQTAWASPLWIARG